MHTDYSRTGGSGVKKSLPGEIDFSGWHDVGNVMDLVRDPDYVVPVVSPEKLSGIYFLFLQRTLVYVGQSIDVETRLRSHLDKDYDSFRWMSAPSDRLNDLEGYFIAFLRPHYNKSIPGNSVVVTRKQAGSMAYREFGRGLKQTMLEGAYCGDFWTGGQLMPYFFYPQILANVQASLAEVA